MTISASDVVEAVIEAFMDAGVSQPDTEESMAVMYNLLHSGEYILLEQDEFERLAESERKLESVMEYLKALNQTIGNLVTGFIKDAFARTILITEQVKIGGFLDDGLP
jgi:hypothetical protein